MNTLNILLSIIFAVNTVAIYDYEKGRRTRGGFITSIMFIVYYVLLYVMDYIFLTPQIASEKVFALFLLGLMSAFSSWAFSEIEYEYRKDQLHPSIPFVIPAIAILIFCTFIISDISGSKDKYEALDVEIKEEMPAFDEKSKPISVPLVFAKNKMRKSFGQVPNSSFYQLGEPRIQTLNGEIVYVAPVEFSSYFKWKKENTSPGYFTLSATDTSANPKFVKKEMKYVSSAYFGNNADRMIYKNDPKLLYKGQSIFEIGDDGTPYTYGTYGEFIKKYGRVGFKPKGVSILNGETGKVEKYKLKDAPKWINGSVSSETASYQNKVYGKYPLGFWNSILSQKDVIIPSENGNQNEVTPVFLEDKMYYFSDFSSPKKGIDSMMGYTLTDANTGKITYYSGNEGDSLMDSYGAIEVTDKKFVEKKWNSSIPILYNLYGEPSWFVSVTDENGFLQQVAIVSAKNPEKFVSGTSTSDVLKRYKKVIGSGDVSSIDGDSNEEVHSGKLEVNRVYKERDEDGTNVFILSKDGELYVGSSDIYESLIFVEEGDELKIEYQMSNSEFYPITKVKKISHK